MLLRLRLLAIGGLANGGNQRLRANIYAEQYTVLVEVLQRDAL
jgi:hypothetical protein